MHYSAEETHVHQDNSGSTARFGTTVINTGRDIFEVGRHLKMISL